MMPFVKEAGVAVPLDRPNVDTDQIIPKQFLKRIERSGFGEFLFYDWRYLDDGKTPNPAFELNSPRYAGATILIAGKNFGCGSSREHAPWALMDYGFRAIIAPSYADIFFNNCLKNGLLPIVLPEDVVNGMLARAAREDVYTLTIDLNAQTVSDDSGHEIRFTIDPFRKNCLLHGLDDIGLTLVHSKEIVEYEAARPPWRQPVHA